MKQVLNLGTLGKKLDHKMSKDEMLQYCMERLQWVTDTLFGQRDSAGKLIKSEHKDVAGKVLHTNYQVGLLQKLEGVYEFNEETKQPELKQPGLEQLFTTLQQELLYLSENFERLIVANKTQTAMFATILKISPQAWFDLTGDKNQEMNAWMQNYKTILDANEAKERAEEAKQAEVLKELKPNEQN